MKINSAKPTSSDPPASLASIAREVGVDPSLVSRVLRADPGARISPKKRAQIIEVAERTSYRPNRVAQSLRMRRTHILAMLTPDITNPFHSWLFRAVEARANRSGYDVILCNTDDDPERSLKVVSTLCEGHVDGLLLAMARDEDPSIELLRRQKIPYVLVNRRRRDRNESWFGTDSFGIGRMGAEHLLGLGHHRIAYIDGDMTVDQLGDRRSGFLAVMAEAGVPVDPDLVAVGLPTRLEARRCMRAMFELPRTRWPTAIFAPRTVLIDGVMDAVHAAGLRMPDDVSILGFSAVPDPAFTSICAPLGEIGERAVEHLIETVESGPRDDGARQVTFGVAIVDRGTTAPPRA